MAMAVPGGERAADANQTDPEKVVCQLRTREREEGPDRAQSGMKPRIAVRTIEEPKHDAAQGHGLALLGVLNSDIELDAEVISTRRSATQGPGKDNEADEDDRSETNLGGKCRFEGDGND